jgi:hypothetical protein
MNRRSMLKAMAATGALAACPPALLAQAGRGNVFRYLETLARDDGGYGWEGQGHSHLSATYFVSGCYRVLGQTPPGRARLAEFVRTRHPSVLKKLEQERRIFEFQQVQTLVWLDADSAVLKDKVLQWTEPLAYLKQYERNGYPLFSSEMGVILSRALLGIPREELPRAFVEYLDSRRRENGSFNNTPAVDGSDGHILSTWWGLQALEVLAPPERLKDATAAWIRSCQLPNGGFTFQPRPEFGGVDDVAYTWSAVKALKLLGSEPIHRRNCVEYLHSLANEDGGFGDRAGWLSNPMATFYALDALSALGEENPGIPPAHRTSKVTASLPPGLKLFTIQLEAHGQGSPAEAVELARSLRIHLWGAKNAKPEWLQRAQAIADNRNVPVKFFVSNEEYGTWINVPGIGTYSHMSDVIAPADSTIGASLANEEAASWQEFRERRLAPLEKAGGRLIWQFGENEELVRMFLDDSVERGGYAAISTYHFGNPDFTNSEPFLHRWRGKLPFIALQDAHGPEPWWFADMTTGFRTVFLATEPTWDGWLDALKNNWVVPIRRDQWTGGKTWMHAGSAVVREFVESRELEWRWWDNPTIHRPLVSMVAVHAGDAFETASPDSGITLRIRCAWENNPQGRLKQPRAEFVKLTVDDREAKPLLVARKRPNGPLLDDYYHHLHLPDITPGGHSATVIVRDLGSGQMIHQTIEFSG